MMQHSAQFEPIPLGGEKILYNIDKVISHVTFLEPERVDESLTEEGVLWVTNYQLIWKTSLFAQEQGKNAEFHVPLANISSIRKIAKQKAKGWAGGLIFFCKDFRSQALVFCDSAPFKIVYDLIQSRLVPKTITELFPFSYRDPKVVGEESGELWTVFSWEEEFARQGMLLNENWRISQVNIKHTICEAYPRYAFSWKIMLKFQRNSCSQKGF
jgi:hypothetical protein